MDRADIVHGHHNRSYFYDRRKDVPYIIKEILESPDYRTQSTRLFITATSVVNERNPEPCDAMVWRGYDDEFIRDFTNKKPPSKDMPVIKVLDHGHVRLFEHMGSDLSIVRNARVSYDADWRAGESDRGDRKLINYLYKNRHTTPFETVEFTFDVKAPIFVFRQWHRHRTWSYNEVSARYTELPEEFYVPELSQITTQSSSNKQMRTTEQNPKAQVIQNGIRNQCAEAFEIYRMMLEDGCPRELARSVLPVATYSHMFAKTDLHNLFHFLHLRLHEHAQYEIRVYAEAILELIEPIVPVAVAAFREHTLGG